MFHLKLKEKIHHNMYVFTSLDVNAKKNVDPVMIMLHLNINNTIVPCLRDNESYQQTDLLNRCSARKFFFL